MPDHEHIYRMKAHLYHRLIAAQPDLSNIMEELYPGGDLDILDLGAGSGRLTLSLLPRARSLSASDLSPAMLEELVRNVPLSCHSRLMTIAADHRNLPLPDHSFDLIVSGWSLCYLAGSDEPEWEANLKQMMSEIDRLLRPGGTVILFETMGTGYTAPQPPPFLLEYYNQLERQYEFGHRWIRTDYTFRSPQEAEELTRFFFGDALADEVRQKGLPIVPECAGVWWKRKSKESGKVHPA
ncbi:Methyltransferase type 11 [Paenibacillus mucilaginosus 3016]|uniref:Methyltransferase type 11 n=1 Tax=Paenibacillus mucilaginosus 3016 TaxID=1116391 RepID=H6NSB5_9BACL|nr:class I SAM-dependent methyltransferase [Paenibacillus mucilaginosus]AFC27409.1 Methyltransferase type 11 [Paenibacillus mucilaginosus 3016]WFA16317.1 class I SAM-dependent methyltransferase [Paenibacillus mucilaginosus]